MITISMGPNIIRMEGHADCSVNGQDIVCSAISALTCNLIDTLEQLTGNRIRAETGSGYTTVEWNEMDDEGCLLVSSWFLGLSNINNQYHCMEFRDI